jgi:hypothetical protein
LHKDERKLARKRGDHRPFSNETSKKMKKRDINKGKKGTW